MFGSVYLNMANFEREIQDASANKKESEKALLSRGESEEESSTLSSSLPSVKTLTHRLAKPLSRKLSHKKLSEK